MYSITVKEYFELVDTSEYDIFIDVMTPCNKFAGYTCNLKNLSFDEVELMKRTFANPDLEGIKDIIIMCFRMRGTVNVSAEYEYYNASIFELFASKLYLEAFIIERIELENSLLVGTPNDKAIMVGASERLRPVSHLLTKMRLAERFGCAPKEIGAWTYLEVFTIMLADHMQGEVIKDMENIK